MCVCEAHKRDLRFGDPRNDGRRAYYLLVNASLRGHFGPLHPGYWQDVFSYLKTRRCCFHGLAFYSGGGFQMAPEIIPVKGGKQHAEYMEGTLVLLKSETEVCADTAVPLL